MDSCMAPHHRVQNLGEQTKRHRGCTSLCKKPFWKKKLGSFLRLDYLPLKPLIFQAFQSWNESWRYPILFSSTLFLLLQISSWEISLSLEQSSTGRSLQHLIMIRQVWKISARCCTNVLACTCRHLSTALPTQINIASDENEYLRSLMKQSRRTMHISNIIRVLSLSLSLSSLSLTLSNMYQ